MIARLIEFSARNRLLVGPLIVALAGIGIWAVNNQHRLGRLSPSVEAWLIRLNPLLTGPDQGNRLNRLVENGMTSEVVTRLLGPPDFVEGGEGPVTCEPVVLWEYVDYQLGIAFDARGKVIFHSQ